MLDARLHSRIGRIELDVALSLADGGTLVLAGGNGAGKTSVLRLDRKSTRLNSSHL